MPYLKAYSIAWDQTYQSWISQETAKAVPADCQTSEAPFKNCPIMPRERSKWNAELIKKRLREVAERQAQTPSTDELSK